MHHISPEELSERLKTDQPPWLLDVREPDEHKMAALPGSRLIPLGELMERVDELAPWKAEEVVVYCHHGMRSLHAIAQLRAAGFEKLFNLTGGIDQWSRQIDRSVPRY